MKRIALLLALIVVLISSSSTMALAQDSCIPGGKNHDACNAALEVAAEKVLTNQLDTIIVSNKRTGHVAFSVVLEDACSWSANCTIALDPHAAIGPRTVPCPGPHGHEYSPLGTVYYHVLRSATVCHADSQRIKICRFCDDAYIYGSLTSLGNHTQETVIGEELLGTQGVPKPLPS